MNRDDQPRDGLAPSGAPRPRARPLVVLLVLAVVATACHRLTILENPSLVAEGTIITRPFSGTSTFMLDGEGMTYVPVNARLWLTEDNGDMLYEVDPSSGQLDSTITSAALAAAPRFGGGPAAGVDRSSDLDALAYDAVADDLFVVSNGCCSPSGEPTIFRLTRSSPSGTFTPESWQPLSQAYQGATATPAGELHLSAGTSVEPYDYVTNTFGVPVTIPGISVGIVGMDFSTDGHDLFVVAENTVYRVDWASTTIVPGYTFDLATVGVFEGRSAELIGTRLYVLDGDDSVPSGDPLRFAVHRFRVDGALQSPSPPVAAVTATPQAGSAPLTVSFDASASFDPDGSVVAYHWSFGDGHLAVTSNPVVDHTYTSAGTYTSLQIIEDDGGNVAFNSITITVDGAGGTGQAQTSFRIRTGDDVALNSNSGWAAGKGTNATLPILDDEFRIRFQVSGIGSTNDQYELWYRKDSGSWLKVPTNNNPWAESPAASAQHEVQLVPSPHYSNGADTTELLNGADVFVTGEGRESAPTGSIAIGSNNETEIEFNILIRKWSEDGHVDDGTKFKFRVRKKGGSQLASYLDTPTVTIGNRAGHIGGSFVESPDTPIVADKDGNLYAAIEATDQTGGPFRAEMVIAKSTDGGDTWTAPDLASRPGHMDIEALDMHYVEADDTIHIAYQGPLGDHVFYLPYRTAGHATPDTYGTAEQINGSADPIDGQSVSIRKRSTDGVIYIAFNDSASGKSRVTVMRKDPTWGNAISLDSSSGVDIGGAMMEIDSSGVIHLVYTELEATTIDGDLYHRSISTADVKSGRTRVNSSGTTLDSISAGARRPHAPPVIYFDGGVERIAVLFADSDDRLYFTESPVSTIAFSPDESVSAAAIDMGAGGSNSAVASLAVDDVDDEPIALWVDNTYDNRLMTDVRTGGSWGTDTVERTGTYRTGWVRAITFQHSPGNGSDRVVGILLDDHPDPGGTGGIAYYEIVRP